MDEKIMLWNTTLSTSEGPVDGGVHSIFNVKMKRSRNGFASPNSPNPKPHKQIRRENITEQKQSNLHNKAPTTPFRDFKASPFFKVTVGLHATLTAINNISIARKVQRNLIKATFDDEDANLLVQPNEIFNNRYRAQCIIGKGSFGHVLKAVDILTNSSVAIKIIKNKKPFFKQAQMEIKLLHLIKQKDPTDKYHIIKLQDSFVHRNHMCMTFELLSCNLYDLIRHSNFQGISLNLLRKFAFQALTALHFLSTKCDIIHCDLKPENILLLHPKRTAIKLIDFGSSCQSNHKLFKYIQSRYYRSPEVLLELEYKHEIDMWGLGCVLVELHTGEPLFAGRTEFDQMVKICEVLGLPNERMVFVSPKAKFFFQFERKGNGCSYRLKRTDTWRPRKLGDIVRRGTIQEGDAAETYDQFQNLVERMLAYEPQQRIKPADALRHPFFKNAGAYGGLGGSGKDPREKKQLPQLRRGISLPMELDKIDS